MCWVFLWILLSTGHVFTCKPRAPLCSSPQRDFRLFRSTSLAPESSPLLDVAIIGAGPSGLLSAHLLLQQENIRVTLIEGRSDPRRKEAEDRAYALGIGIRGRTAIQTVDQTLWQAVKNRGYESERFQLHIAGLVIPLRSEDDSKKRDDHSQAIEPSLLTYQTDLCGALLDELETRYNEERLQIYFDTAIKSCDLDSMTVSLRHSTTESATTSLSSRPFDLMVGSDGVNSVVRAAIEQNHPSFQCTKELLPGEFKVVRLDKAPPKVDPSSVSLILPKSGSTSAFVEPIGTDGSCCILFAGREGSAILTENSNQTAVIEELTVCFPQWKSLSELIATKLQAQKVTGTASSVVCNTYHYNERAVLVGDAAHATGGVSGQGVNSALQDCVTLANSIQSHRHDIAEALLLYSQKQVPEGKALYDLSFGPKPTGFKAFVWVFGIAVDTLFRGRFGIGRVPLQTRLTTTLTPFAEIRRESDHFYADQFPRNNEIGQRLKDLHLQAMKSAKANAKQ